MIENTEDHISLHKLNDGSTAVMIKPGHRLKLDLNQLLPPIIPEKKPFVSRRGFGGRAMVGMEGKVESAEWVVLGIEGKVESAKATRLSLTAPPIPSQDESADRSVDSQATTVGIIASAPTLPRQDESADRSVDSQATSPV